MNAPSSKAPPALISLGDPKATQVPEAVLDAPGGFAWWYVDTVDANGNGAVVIWSWGLPFLPGYLSGARAGDGDPARARPSLNLAVYRNRKRAFYLLQEYLPEAASMDGAGNFHFGDTRMSRPQEDRVRIDFDAEVPGSGARLQGTLEVEGPPAHLAGSTPSADLAHRWTPVLGPSRAKGVLTVGSERFEIDGPAYHDRNEGTHRFDDLGIDHWSWGRLVTPERTAIWYLCYAKDGPPVAWGAELLADGAVRVQEMEAILEAPRKGAFGLRTWRRVELREAGSSEPWLEAEVGARVDDGPFYARTVVNVVAGSQRGMGLAEWIVPDRIDLGRHRPLVRMAVHDLRGSNSFWLPLFSGPSRGRMARLLRRRA
ncbi:MAG: hypothetical protein AAFZ18_06845 [Myxococcota bacterium]